MFVQACPCLNHPESHFLSSHCSGKVHLTLAITTGVGSVVVIFPQTLSLFEVDVGDVSCKILVWLKHLPR